MNNVSFKVVESSKIDESMGISDERSDELIEILEKAHKKPSNTSITQTLAEASTHCKSLEEIVYAALMYGMHIGEQKHRELRMSAD